jgi:hypothetical protein
LVIGHWQQRSEADFPKEQSDEESFSSQSITQPLILLSIFSLLTLVVNSVGVSVLEETASGSVRNARLFVWENMIPNLFYLS